jgi:NADP-dependent 3-hydroxy acid dehydrogenase YdfG
VTDRRMASQLAGTTALITGASSGIGAATAIGELWIMPTAQV